MAQGKNLALTLGAVGAGVWLAYKAYRWANRFDFAGKTVLVTGGSRGLGLVLARHLAREGANLAICARDPDELDRARDDLARHGATNVQTVVCDITDRGQVERMVQEVRERFGGVDVLINNAGTIAVGPVQTMTLDDYREAMDTHFWAPLYTTLAALPDMRRRGGGRVVNITSIGGKVAVPHLVPYDASKFALVGLSEGLRAELAQEGIVVTTVVPGLMRTGSPPNAYFKSRHRAEYAWFTIGDSTPGYAMHADRAAGKILNACRLGEAEVILTVPAKLAVWFHGLFPGLTSDILAVVNRTLPGPGGIGTQRVRGWQSQSEWAPSALTALSDRATRQNNEEPSRP